MSLRKGNRAKGAPKHQNAFAFRHNKHSTKTARLMEKAPRYTAGLCSRCKDIIDWKLRYRKFKPLKRPAKCNHCKEPKIQAAYHTLCQACAKDKGVCAKCCREAEIVSELPSELHTDLEAKLKQLQAGSVPGMKERERRSLLRELERSGGVLEVDSDDEDAGSGGGGDRDGMVDDDHPVEPGRGVGVGAGAGTGAGAAGASAGGAAALPR